MSTVAAGRLLRSRRVGLPAFLALGYSVHDLYGTTIGGDVFAMTAAGAVTTLIDLSGENGSVPRAGVIQASDGRFYGTTFEGGPGPLGASGTIFRIDTARDFATLHAFGSSASGAFPQAGLSEREGVLFGTTTRGGTGGWGTVFKLDRSGSLATLHDFVAGSDGRAPAAEVLPASDGKLYGTTEGVFSDMFGTLFSLDATGTLSTVHVFASDDAAPDADHLIEASDRSIYGTTHRGVFKRDAAGVVTTVPIGPVPVGPEAVVLASPQALIEAADRNIYGTTVADGETGQGTIFRLAPASTATSPRLNSVSEPCLRSTAPARSKRCIASPAPMVPIQADAFFRRVTAACMARRRAEDRVSAAWSIA
jgi:uncharacterized repeat protein (TIGR03803 family)